MATGMNGPQAQDYPAVTIIVPIAAGEPVDITGRIVADIFNRHLGQKFVVENVGGAGGAIGALRAARATAEDTRSCPATWAPMRWRQRSNLGYDPQRDFEPIGLTRRIS